MKENELLPAKPININLKGCFIAGGSILSIVTETDINDFDIYPKSQLDFENILMDLLEKEDCYIINISEKAVTLKSKKHKDYLNNEYTFQVMFFNYYNTPEEIFHSFDFTVCMAAFDFDNLEYHFHSNFYQDIASKTLRYNENALFPLSSLLRVKKYSEKGYELGKTCNIKLAVSLMNRGLPETWKELEEEIGGLYGSKPSIEDKNIKFSYENIVNFLDTINPERLNQESKNTQIYEFLSNNYNSVLEYFKINEYECVLVEKEKLKETVPKSFIENIGKKIKTKDISDDKKKTFFVYTNYILLNRTSDFILNRVIFNIDTKLFKDKQTAIENKYDNQYLYIATVSLGDIQSAYSVSKGNTIKSTKAKVAAKITSYDDSMDNDILEAYAGILES